MKLAFVLSVFAFAAAAHAWTLECPSENSISFDGTIVAGQWTLLDIHSDPDAGVSLFNAFAAGYPNYSFENGVNTDVMLEIVDDGGDFHLTITGIAYGGDGGGDYELGLDYRCDTLTEVAGGIEGRDCYGNLSKDPMGLNQILPVTGKSVGGPGGAELTLLSKYDLRYELFAWVKYSPLFDLNTVVSGDINGKLACREICIPFCDENGAGPEGSCMDDGCGGICPCPEGQFCNGDICTMAPTECLEEGMNWDPEGCATFGLGELSLGNAIILPNSYDAGVVMLDWAEGSGEEGSFDGAWFDYCYDEGGDTTFMIGGEVIYDGEVCTIAYSCDSVEYDEEDPEFVRGDDCHGQIICDEAGTLNLGGKSNGFSEFEIHTKWGVTKGSGWVEYLAWTEEGGLESGGLANGDINFTFVCQWGGEIETGPF